MISTEKDSITGVHVCKFWTVVSLYPGAIQKIQKEVAGTLAHLPSIYIDTSYFSEIL